MNKKLLKVALVGKTNAGKSTLINSLVGEKISIINKKINTTQDNILGVKNIDKVQIIFYDTPGSNFLKTSNLLQKKLKTNIWEAIDNVDILIYLIDVLKYNYENTKKDILKISEVNKPIIILFNKIDVFDNKKILSFIEELKNLSQINEFFLISAKYKTHIESLINYLHDRSSSNEWLYKDNEITDKDDIYISNECTRNAILYYLHQEIPYNLKVTNTSFLFLKNKDLKIKQNIELNNQRYKPIILGKKGITIKNIREKSQLEIQNIFDCKVHLYLQIIFKDEK
jgi:GTPase